MQKESRIKYFSISFFSIILGLVGFSVAFQKAEEILKMPFSLSNYFLGFTVGVFGLITIIYLIKMIRYFGEVKKEFNSPIKLNFFPTFSISFILLSIAFLSINLTVSKYLWFIGTALNLVLTIKIISIWITHDKFEIKHMNPAWFIPAVGNILEPVAGVKHVPIEFSWFFFSVGFVFWVVLLIIFFNRIIFHHPLPNKLLPTLFILIAPPAVGFISIVKLTGMVNDFAKILYYFAFFLLLLLLAQIRMFLKIKFYLSWWAYSFPISAISIATILMYHETKLDAFKYISFGLLGLLCGIILILFIKTPIAIFKRELCVEED